MHFLLKIIILTPNRHVSFPAVDGGAPVDGSGLVDMTPTHRPAEEDGQEDGRYPSHDSDRSDTPLKPTNSTPAKSKSKTAAPTDQVAVGRSVGAGRPTDLLALYPALEQRPKHHPAGSVWWFICIALPVITVSGDIAFVFFLGPAETKIGLLAVRRKDEFAPYKSMAVVLTMVGAITAQNLSSDTQHPSPTLTAHRLA